MSVFTLFVNGKEYIEKTNKS